MHGGDFFFQAFVYLAAAVVSVPLAKRLGLGSVLGYLIAGVAIGPFALGLVGEEGQDVMQFAEFGVVMMLFLVGLELQPRLVWRLRGPILGLGGLQLSATAAAVTLLAALLGFDWRIGVAAGLILAMSSTAIVLQTLQEKGLMRTEAGQNAFSVLLFQDLAVIPILALLPLLAAGAASGHGDGGGHGATAWISGLPGWGRGLAVMGAVLAIVGGGRFLMRPVFRFIAQVRLREVFTAAALLIVIGIALLMTQVGLSPALGTFLAGVVLADSEYRHELEGDIEPFKGLLLGLFFIAVGASIDFQLIAAEPLRITALVLGLVILKAAVLFVLGRAFRMGLDQNLLLAFALAQGGEFAFVLFAFAVQNGVLPADVTASLVAVVALSMAFTPLLMLVNERLVQPRFGTREAEERPADAIDEHHPVIIAGFGRFGNTVGRLLRANGVGTTVLDFDSDRVELLRRLGLKVFYGDATRLDLLRAAGAADARLLILALDEAEEMRKLVETVRRHFPHLTVLARAFDRPDAFDLIEAGVTHVYRDTLDTALRVGVDALRLLGHRAHQATRAAAKFRRHDEAALRELLATRHDRVGFVTLARQRIRDLERAIQADLAEEDGERDIAWDAESLRRDFGGRDG
jgi:monovalent cation:proton antiporter-2 (CPA2) family protein